MNPYLEASWPDVHTRLIGSIADALGAQLPTGLVARSEEAVVVGDVEEQVDRWVEIRSPGGKVVTIIEVISPWNRETTYGRRRYLKKQECCLRSTTSLQPLIDRCYELGGYWQGDYREEPNPPVLPEEREWLDERLRAAGLR